MANTEELFDFDKGFNVELVAGVDEAGRGPLAGPVVCACCCLPLNESSKILGVNDSKKLSPKKREALFEKIKSEAIAYSIVEISEKIIDEVNILNATKIGMNRAISEVKTKLEILKKKLDLVLIDAVKLEDINIKQKNIIKGDAKSYNIAGASILAKVYRDNLMVELSKNFPEYNFEKHKGYGTKDHIERLKKFGKCKIHRASFIKNFVE